MTGDDQPPVGDDLHAQAQAFAAELTNTVRAVISSDVAEFRPVATTTGRLVVSQGDEKGIDLTVEQAHLLRLKIEYRCTWDTHERFLAVEQSELKVLAAHDSEPLFRFDYQRAGGHDTRPSAHLQVHAHRDAVTCMMCQAGRRSARGRRRATTASRGTDMPRMRDLHFPLGGPRFRPCLEDLLEMLLDELGVDHLPEARDALAAGREKWRRRQLAAAVRDSPQTAAFVLRNLGYGVRAPKGGEPADRLDRLRRY